MTDASNSLPAPVRQAARQAVAWGWPSGSDPKSALEQAGIPTQGRVMVIIGFQSCITHNFAELQRKAADEKATLYVINGVPGLVDPHISVNGEDLHVATRLQTPEDIQKVAGQLGLLARIDRIGSLPVVISSGYKLFEDGKPVADKKLSLRTPSSPQRA